MNFGRFSDYQVEAWLRDLATSWVALHYDDPDVAGAYASEVFGGSYVRCKVSMSTPANRATWNVTNLTWTGLPGIMVTHLAAWDAPTNGNFITSSPLPNRVRILPGGRYDLGSGQYALSFA